MHVERIRDFSHFETRAADWDCLAHGKPFRSFAWAHAWWQQFHGGRELYCLGVFTPQKVLVGLLPLLRERSLAQGNVLRLLGISRLAAAFPSLLTTHEHALPVTQLLSDYLHQAAHGGEDRWDQWLIEGESSNDRWLGRLIAGLAEEGHGVERRTIGGTWQLPLSAEGSDYCASLSANHRQQLRKCERRLEAVGEVLIRRTQTPEELESQFHKLLWLHAACQTKRERVNRLQSPAQEQFLRSAAEALASLGQAAIYSLEVAGQTIAAELLFFGGETAYAYLSGWHPDWQRFSPGSLLQKRVLAELQSEGLRTYDLLDAAVNDARHWRGILRPTLEIRLQAQPKVGTPGITIPGEAMRAWLKTSITLNGMQ